MNKKLWWFLGFLVLLFLGFLFLRFVLGGPEDSWICRQGEWVKHGNPSAPRPTSACQERKSLFDFGKKERQEEEKPELAVEQSRDLAEKAVKESATYKFDGFDLKFVNSEALKCPSCWAFNFSFSSRHGGYGDRKGQIITQVITPHEIAATVDQGKITAMVTDGIYDEINGVFIK